MAASEAFARWLQEEIAKRGWNQAELARRSGVTAPQVGRVMTGERGAGLDFYTGIARAFSMPLEGVLRRAGILPAAGAAPDDGELLSYFHQLSPGDRQRVIAVARSLWQTDQDLKR